MATGVEERSSAVADVPAALVEAEVEDSAEGDLVDAVTSRANTEDTSFDDAKVGS